jgi:RraA family protein
VAVKPKSAEIHPGPGFRVRTQITRPDPALIEQYRQFPTPDISDLLNRLYTMTSEIKNLSNDTPFVGPACTVKVYPGDNLFVHKALDVVQPGDVMVIDAGGSYLNAVLGDLIANKAMHRGVAGIIIDGLIRDLPGVQETKLPVFARGVTPIGPLHRGPGELNYPISCGGIVVNQGDIIAADDNGVVVVRQDFAEELLQRLYVQRDALEAYVADVKRGKFSNEWVDRALEDANCRVSQ